jgi:hypothetical protein
MNDLNIGRDVFRDELFSFRVDFPQGSSFSLRSRFFEGTPFHEKLSAVSHQRSAKICGTKQT